MSLPAINSPIVQSQIEKSTSDIINRMANGEITSLQQLRVEIFSKFYGHFTELSERKFKSTPFTEDSFRDFDIWNANQVNINRILTTLFTEARDLNNLLLNQHNLMSQSANDIVSKASNLQERLRSIRETLEVKQFFNKGKSVTIIEDNFTNTDNVDFSSTTGINIDLSISSATLSPASNLSRSSSVIDVQVTTNKDTDISTAIYKEDGIFTKPRAYEGNRFDFYGSARPQSGVWRIEAKNTKLDKSVPDIDRDKYYTNLNTSIYGEGGSTGGGAGAALPTTKQVTETKTVYTIFKDAVQFDTDATSITRKGTSDEVMGWVDKNGTTVTPSYDDLAVYTQTSETKTVTSTVTLSADELHEQELAAIEAAGTADEGSIDNILKETGSGFELKDIGVTRITPDNYIFDDRAVDANDIIYADAGSDEYASTVTREDFKYIETLPTEAQLQDSRKSMFDGDPNSFWEVEYTPVVESLSPTAIHNTLSGVDPTAMGSASDTDESSYAQYQSLSNKFFAGNSPEDLTVTLKITLDDSYVINYMDLSPFFFESADTASFTITDIKTQEDNSSPMLAIPGFNTDFNNTINRTSNQSLSDSQLDQSGVANRFVFRAKGFWSFPKRKAKYIYITIKQDSAIPNPYQLKMVQLLKKSNFSITQSKSYGSVEKEMFKTRTKDKSGSGNILERGRTTTLVQFSYLETVLANLESSSTALLAGASGSSTFELNNSTNAEDRKDGGTGGLGAMIGAQVGTGIMSASMPQPAPPTSTTGATAGLIFAGVVGTVMGALIDQAFSVADGTKSSSALSKSYNDTGFTINKEFTRTIWSRGRYAIGIRDIGIYSKTYVDSGVLTSKAYSVLGGKKILSLEVGHSIPLEFTNYMDSTPWIDYYIIINDTPIRIQPSKMPPPSLPFEGLPNQIDLSRYGDDTTIISVRFRAIIKRPSEAVLRNADSQAPLLNRYKLIIESV